MLDLQRKISYVQAEIQTRAHSQNVLIFQLLSDLVEFKSFVLVYKQCVSLLFLIYLTHRIYFV